MIQSVIVEEAGLAKNLTSAQLGDFAGKKFVWVDVESPQREDFDLLQKHFALHQLSHDPIFERHVRPKLLDFQGHLLVVMHEPVQEAKGIDYIRLVILIGKNFVITLHNKSIPCVDSVRASLSGNPVTLKKGASFLLHELLDHLVDSYFPILDKLDADLDALENKALAADPMAVKQIFLIKKRVLDIRRRITPAREVLSTLSRHDSEIIDRNTLIYFRDVYDHSIRIIDMTDAYRDLVTSILDVYISVQTNKMNEIIKVLTVIATIFIPITLVTSFYGMNIFFPEVEFFGHNAYYFILLFMLAVVAALVFYFKKKGWW